MLWSCLKVWFVLNQIRTKALSDQMSFRSISKCWYYSSHCCKCFSFVVFFLFLCDTWSALVSNANSQWGNPSQKSKPMVSWGCRFNLSHGYLNIYLPPIFMCLLSLVLMYLSKQALLFDCICLFSLWPKTHDHRSGPSERSVTYMLLSVGECVWVCSHVYVHFCNRNVT